MSTHNQDSGGELRVERRCSVEGCDKPVRGQGLCNAHYKRKMRHGDPLGGGVRHGAAWKYLNDVVLNFAGSECLVWPFTRAGNGYPYVRVNGRSVGAHRVVCEITNGPAPSARHEAAHTCGKGHEGCVNPRHLVWKTSKENKADMLVHGTRHRGSRHKMAVLTEEQVMQIRALRGSVSGADLSVRYGVSRPTITAIQKKVSWAWL